MPEIIQVPGLTSDQTQPFCLLSHQCSPCPLSQVQLHPLGHAHGAKALWTWDTEMGRRYRACLWPQIAHSPAEEARCDRDESGVGWRVAVGGLIRETHWSWALEGSAGGYQENRGLQIGMLFAAVLCGLDTTHIPDLHRCISVRNACLLFPHLPKSCLPCRDQTWSQLCPESS